jgi:hypothetical protein
MGILPVPSIAEGSEQRESKGLPWIGILPAAALRCCALGSGAAAASSNPIFVGRGGIYPGRNCGNPAISWIEFQLPLAPGQEFTLSLPNWRNPRLCGPGFTPAMKNDLMHFPTACAGSGVYPEPAEWAQFRFCIGRSSLQLHASSFQNLIATHAKLEIAITAHNKAHHIF